MSEGLHDDLGCMNTDAVKFFRPSFSKTLGDSDAQRHRSVLWVQIFSSLFSLQRAEWWRLPMTTHDRQEAEVLIQKSEDLHSMFSSAWDESKPYLAPFSFLQPLDWILLWRQGIPWLFSQSRVIAQTRTSFREPERENTQESASLCHPLLQHSAEGMRHWLQKSLYIFSQCFTALNIQRKKSANEQLKPVVVI